EREATPIIDRMIDEGVKKLDALSKKFTEAIGDAALSRLGKAMVTAQGLEELAAAITPEFLRKVMALMNTPLGFMTDRGPHNPKQPQLYAEETVKRCLVEGFLRGVYPFDNEFNIIAGRLYITQAGYARKVREI